MGKYAEHCNFVEENIFATMCAVSTQQETECPPQHKLGGRGRGDRKSERGGKSAHILKRPPGNLSDMHQMLMIKASGRN
mgnify:CR=1 FL=1